MTWDSPQTKHNFCSLSAATSTFRKRGFFLHRIPTKSSCPHLPSSYNECISTSHSSTGHCIITSVAAHDIMNASRLLIPQQGTASSPQSQPMTRAIINITGQVPLISLSSLASPISKPHSCGAFYTLS